MILFDDDPYYCAEHDVVHDGVCPVCEAERIDAYLDEMMCRVD